MNLRIVGVLKLKKITLFYRKFCSFGMINILYFSKMKIFIYSMRVLALEISKYLIINDPFILYIYDTKKDE